LFTLPLLAAHNLSVASKYSILDKNQLSQVSPHQFEGLQRFARSNNMTTMIDLTGDSPPCTPPPKPNRYQPKQLCANDLTSRLQKICSPFAVRNVNTKTLPQLSRNNIRQLTPATADSGISTRNHSERAVLQEADPLQPQELLEQEAEALDLQLDRRAYPTTSSWKKYPVRQSSKLPWHHDISAEQYTAYLEPKLSGRHARDPIDGESV
jgi:hypothetical protein